MPTARCDASALPLAEDHVEILVVGGAHGREVELLSGCFRCEKMRIKSNIDDHSHIPWKWSKLPPMLEAHPRRPGMLRLGEDRVLVVGGNSCSAEVLRLPCRSDGDHNDCVQWTLLARPVTQALKFTFVINVEGRILAFGKHLYIHSPKQYP